MPTYIRKPELDDWIERMADRLPMKPSKEKVAAEIVGRLVELHGEDVGSFRSWLDAPLVPPTAQHSVNADSSIRESTSTHAPNGASISAFNAVQRAESIPIRTADSHSNGSSSASPLSPCSAPTSAHGVSDLSPPSPRRAPDSSAHGVLHPGSSPAKSDCANAGAGDLSGSPLKHGESDSSSSNVKRGVNGNRARKSKLGKRRGKTGKGAK